MVGGIRHLQVRGRQVVPDDDDVPVGEDAEGGEADWQRRAEVDVDRCRPVRHPAFLERIEQDRQKVECRLPLIWGTDRCRLPERDLLESDDDGLLLDDLIGDGLGSGREVGLSDMREDLLGLVDERLPGLAEQGLEVRPEIQVVGHHRELSLRNLGRRRVGARRDCRDGEPRESECHERRTDPGEPASVTGRVAHWPSPSSSPDHATPARSRAHRSSGSPWRTTRREAPQIVKERSLFVLGTSRTSRDERRPPASGGLPCVAWVSGSSPPVAGDGERSEHGYDLGRPQQRLRDGGAPGPSASC